MKYENFTVEVECLPAKDGERKWQITLRVKHQEAAGANSPYSFSLEMVGFVRVATSYPEDKVELLVKTNGPSMLYGAAREVIRDATARGPHVTVFLPSLSFYESGSGAKSQPPAAAPQPKENDVRG